MNKNQSNGANSGVQNFFSGFFLGGIVASTVCYLTLTKSGRKIAREFLRKAEQIGEEGQEYLDELIKQPDAREIKQKAETKISGIIKKLKHEVKSTKKS